MIRIVCLLALCIGCGHRDGIVGVQPLADTPSDVFLEEFESDSARWDEQLPLPNAATSFGKAASEARDGYVAELVLPGAAEPENIGPKYATQRNTRQRFHFGSFRSRLAFGACAPGEEAVQAFFGFFTDDQDHDGDGIADDLEINLQVLCSDPNKLYLTVFTDFDAQPRPRFRKLSRLVDFTNGERFDTPSPESESFESVGVDPALVAPNAFAAGVFHELGFDWSSETLRFSILLGGQERELWTLTGAERIPQEPVYVMLNLWHPESHWYPPQALADYPANDVRMLVDWVSVKPAP